MRTRDKQPSKWSTDPSSVGLDFTDVKILDAIGSGKMSIEDICLWVGAKGGWSGSVHHVPHQEDDRSWLGGGFEDAWEGQRESSESGVDSTWADGFEAVPGCVGCGVIMDTPCSIPHCSRTAVLHLLGDHPICRECGDRKNEKARGRSARARARGQYSPSIVARWSEKKRARMGIG